MSPTPEVDASMRLLREVMAHPVDPAYALASRRRRSGTGRPGWRGKVPSLVTALLALLCGWAVTRGVVELRRPEPGQASTRAALEREITRRTAHADAQQRAITDLRGQISAAQQAQLTSPEDVARVRQADRLALDAGEAAVTGPGLKVTLTDAPVSGGDAVGDPRAGTDAEDGRVLDRDVQAAVNGLWASGAEAISINGRRLTALSAIRSAGQAVLVDFRPLVPPYVISAVGDPAGLQARFARTSAASYLQSIRDTYGVGVEIATATRLDLPGARTFQLRVARTAAPAPGGSTASTSSTPSSTPSTEVSP